ncbi:MAG: class II aldolase/adducin family protein, partial [Gammaproteobacteria bacterium]|nr:class II aldolase/adducin family protein [Gammaproteobacteria bacterium]
MKNCWSDRAAETLVSRFSDVYPRELILRTYSGRLLGSDPALVLHGGGNTSLKGQHPNAAGVLSPALFIKASGFNLATVEPEDHVAVDLERLQSLRALNEVSDDVMLNELCASRFDQRAPIPSVETLVHAFLPGRFVDHTHADAILTLTNQTGGENHVRQALGESVVVLPYVRPGFPLARQIVDTLEVR